MKKTQTATILEMIIALGITAALGSVAVIAYLGYQQSAETADGLATISILEERFAVKQILDGEASQSVTPRSLTPVI